MSHSCKWCKTKKGDRLGQYRDGYWICYSCYPNDVNNYAKSKRCTICKKNSNSGKFTKSKFICEKCVELVEKTGKQKHRKQKNFQQYQIKKQERFEVKCIKKTEKYLKYKISFKLLNVF